MDIGFLKISLKVSKISSALLIFILPSLMYATSNENVRSQRYCEIIVGHGMSALVYSSIGLNNCPQNLWDKINTSKIKKQIGKNIVYLNGPRYLVIDGIVDEQNPQKAVTSFGGIEMRETGVVKLTFKDFLNGFRPYVTHNVNRKTICHYKAGRPIFELISPSKQVFVMLSYSNEIAMLTQDKLPNIGTQLKLPNGWKFKTGILKKDAVLSIVNNKAVVTQDNLKNTYQLSNYDYLDY